MSGWTCTSCGTTGADPASTNCQACGVARPNTVGPFGAGHGPVGTPPDATVPRVPVVTATHQVPGVPGATPGQVPGVPTTGPASSTGLGGRAGFGPPTSTTFPGTPAAGPVRGGGSKRGWWITGGVCAAAVVLVVVLVVVLSTSTSGDHQLATTDVGVTAPTGQSASPTLDGTVDTTVAAPTITVATTVSMDPETAATSKLNELADQGEADAESLVGSWVPQIDSKKVGLVAEGRTWDHRAILANYRSYLSTFPDAIIIRSNQFANFTPNFWVVLVNEPSADSDGALAWCVNANLDRDHCYAHLISHDDVAHATAMQP